MTLDDLLALFRGQVIKIKLEIEISLVTSPEAAPPRPVTYTASCEYCGWTKQYDSPLSAKRAKSAHIAHCSDYADATGYIEAIQKSKSGV